MTQLMQALAWTLLHFCWQAAAVAALFGGLNAMTARRSSNTRYLLALGALLLLLVGSLATFAYELNAGAASGQAAASVGAPYRFSPVTTPASGSAQPDSAILSTSSASARQTFFSFPALPLPALRAVVAFWLLGVLALSLRSFGGWWLIQRLRASAQVEASAAVRASFQRIRNALGIRRPVLLRVSSAIAGPVTVGALRALVLLPVSAVTLLGPEELEVVLAHELAHVRRADFFWNLVQILAETLYFFHPAVWWISARIRHERELCCDDMALGVCPDPVVYASALFHLEQQRSRQWQLAMALDGNQPARSLRMRIARILGEPMADAANRGPFSLAAAAAILVVLLLPVPHVLASLNPAQAAAPVVAVNTKPVLSVAVKTQVETNANVLSQIASKPTVGLTARVKAVSAEATPAIPRELAQASESEPLQNPPSPSATKGDYIDRMKAAGYDVDLDKYVAMKIQDITPEYAAAMGQLGFGKLSADDLIACKVQGVTPEFISGLKQGGIEVKTIHDAISYRIFEVSPEFVTKMKEAGFANLTSQQLLAMRVQGVTPEYARTIVQQYPGATAEDIVKTKIFNIDAAFIEQAKKHGFANLTLEKLVQLRISGIFDDESAK